MLTIYHQNPLSERYPCKLVYHKPTRLLYAGHKIQIVSSFAASLNTYVAAERDDTDTVYR